MVETKSMTSDSVTSSETGAIAELTTTQKYVVLVVSFLGWMFAGLEIALFVLIHRPAVLSLLAGSEVQPNSGSPEDYVTQSFAWFQAAFLLGAASGGWIFGWLGDRFGRTKSLGWSVLCYAIFTGACYFAESVPLLLVLRFLACHGIGGAWPNTVALVAEAWQDASRPFLAGLLGTAANFGQVFMGVVGYSFAVTEDSWRWTLLVGAAPGLLGIICFVGTPESVKWRRARLKKGDAKSQGMSELFQGTLRYRLLIGILLGAIPVIGTAANAQWVVPWTDQVEAAKKKAAAESAGQKDTQEASDSLKKAPSTKESVVAKPNAGKKALTMIQRSGGAVFGSLLGGILATMLGRRLTYFLISFLTLGMSTIVFGFLEPGMPYFGTATFIFGLVGVVYFGWLPLYLPELFPTHVRATGTGISFNTGRAVAAIVVLGTGAFIYLFGGNYAQIGLWTGAIYAAGMVIILFAPKTDGAESKGV